MINYLICALLIVTKYLPNQTITVITELQGKLPLSLLKRFFKTNRTVKKLYGYTRNICKVFNFP